MVKVLNNINLINFTDLTLDEKKMVLSWRNHPSVREWMYNSADILLENHLEFIESLKNSADKLYFLVKQERDYLGVIDFTNIDKERASCEIGLYANVELKGVGTSLLNTICEYAFKSLNLNKLIAEAFAENKKAISLYERFNFKYNMKKILNTKEVICMELKYEDR